ncbi:DNA ligase D [Mucilaginibacter myungsuensis]|uniref:DNA ligase (ATP) n=1 Tax=Mucilaginibacter myungsuensis TaxID=649104 RepID=A0A929L0M4_9SPHI|nr:DNA ligase D [Mucilaginibacter myungsuensis]MBE9664060.1 DNA ligase D [Mucilaginibacter myungsuensis]MDN3601238.1 DNA ligase D [Mucilaginibacter myungsuensis]
MGLAEYVKKRDFKKTSEPKSGKSSNKTLSFVVQRHHASHLHYDFRLELDGVLKSWAVPKGPSLNPNDKRLAMMVEDHPYDYKDFEGIIPNGNYGAGVVMIWDEGEYESLADDRADDVKRLRAGLKSGDLKFRLKGKVLHGEFALVRMKHAEGNSWLLIKHKDEYALDKFDSEDLVPDKIKVLKNNKDGKVKAVPKHKKLAIDLGDVEKEADADIDDTEVEDQPKTSGRHFQPMMAKLADQVFDHEDWIYEKKLDGYRAIGYTAKKAKLISRNGIDFSDQYAKVTEALNSLKKDAVLDGELVIEDKQGKSRFQDIQHYEGDTKDLTLKYYVFDLLSLDGHDLRDMELIKRKELLKSLSSTFSKDSPIIYHDHIKEKGTDLLKNASKEGWEGIIGKDANSYYNSGKRTDRWLKFKITASQEAIICGFTAPTGSRKHFGALILGMNKGDHITYIGNCGTGFNEATLKELFDEMTPLVTDRKPFEDKPNNRTKTTWLKPKLVCEVTYSEWTDDGHLRHPVFKGLREDKSPEKVTMETPDKQMADEESVTIGRKKLKLTNLNKIFWPDEGITKGELLHYYRDMAGYIVPFLKDKPLSMRRQPNGIGDEGFFQKDVDADKLPAWIKTQKIHSESNDKDINYIVGSDEATLLYIVNWGSIEINPWLSNYQKPEHPEFIVIDIDPHDVPFTEAVEVALKVKEVFDRMKTDVYIKTSGSKGLHIYCYVGGKYDYDFAKMFAEYVAHIVHAELPKTTSIERSPAKRPNKTYIDFLQNRRGQTIACPYSVRPKPGATVSTPLHWHEVNNKLKLSDFTIYNVKERLTKIDDPWKDLMSKKADLKKALEVLKEMEGEQD